MTEALPADRAKDESELMRLEDRRIASLISGDVPALDELFADDAISVHSDGVIRGKSELLNNLQIRARFLAIERKSTEIRFYGGTALMIGDVRMRTQARASEPVTRDYRVVQLWVRHDESWKQVSYQATDAVAPP